MLSLTLALIRLSPDLNDLQPLIAGHFLTGGLLTSSPQTDFAETASKNCYKNYASIAGTDGKGNISIN